MGKVEQKKEIILRYLPRVTTVSSWYTKGNIPRSKFVNASQSYAGKVEYEDVIALIDETVFGSGKRGFLFTIDGFYCDGLKGFKMYKDDISFSSMSSLYNITAMNEMLKELYKVECSVDWTSLGKLLKTGMDILTEISDMKIPDKGPDNNSVINNDKKVPVLESAFSATKSEELLDYTKALLQITKKGLNAEISELPSVLKELNGMWTESEKRKLQEGMSYEEEIEELFLKNIDMCENTKVCLKFNELSRNIKRCMIFLENDTEDEIQEDFIKCRGVLTEYFEFVKSVRCSLKDLNANLIMSL